MNHQRPFSTENHYRSWAIVQVIPNTKPQTVARFCHRQDADDHLRVLRRFIPKAAFEVVFEPPYEKESSDSNKMIEQMSKVTKLASTVEASL